jgi:hypothetical protein
MHSAHHSAMMTLSPLLHGSTSKEHTYTRFAHTTSQYFFDGIFLRSSCNWTASATALAALDQLLQRIRLGEIKVECLQCDRHRRRRPEQPEV